MTSQQLHWSVVMLVLDQHYYDDAGHQHGDIRYTVVAVVLLKKWTGVRSKNLDDRRKYILPFISML